RHRRKSTPSSPQPDLLRRSPALQQPATKLFSSHTPQIGLNRSVERTARSLQPPFAIVMPLLLRDAEHHAIAIRPIIRCRAVKHAVLALDQTGIRLSALYRAARETVQRFQFPARREFKDRAA